MPDNLIQQVHAIEQEAENLIKKAHAEATALDNDTDARIKKLQTELDQKFQEEAKAISSKIGADGQDQQEKLKKTFQAAIEGVRNIKVEGAKVLVDKVVERIIGS